MILNDVLTACRDELAASHAPNTASTYYKSLHIFARYLETALPSPVEVNKVSMKHFVGYPAYLKAENYTRSSMRVHLAAAQYLLEWLEIGNLIEPTHRESTLYKKAVARATARHGKRLVKSPNPRDVDSMIEAARALDLPSPRHERNLALVLFLQSSGCRNAEAAALRVGQLDMVACSGVLIGKGDKERVFAFSTATARALESYWIARGAAAPTDPAFARHDDAAGKKIARPLSTGAIREIVSLVRAVAGVEGKFTPHSFRHAFGTLMLKKTGNLGLVQDAMGHENPNTTVVYAETKKEDMIEAHHEVYK